MVSESGKAALKASESKREPVSSTIWATVKSGGQTKQLHACFMEQYWGKHKTKSDNGICSLPQQQMSLSTCWKGDGLAKFQASIIWLFDTGSPVWSMASQGGPPENPTHCCSREAYRCHFLWGSVYSCRGRRGRRQARWTSQSFLNLSLVPLVPLCLAFFLTILIQLFKELAPLLCYNSHFLCDFFTKLIVPNAFRLLAPLFLEANLLI